jgi:preprotein translocase subunit SecG
MKTLTTVVLALILGLVLTAQVFAQGDRTDDLSKAISQGSSGISRQSKW